MALTVAVLGAGSVGRTLATGWAAKGHRIVVGTREPSSDRITTALAEIGASASAATSVDAAAAADVVVLAVPGAATPALIAELGPSIAGKPVIDTTNNLDPTAPVNAMAPLVEAGAVPYRVFNSVGVEQMGDPVFGALHADMSYCGGATHRDKIETLISDLGFRPVYFGDDKRALEAVDALGRVWFLLAFRQGYGRRLAVRFLTADDDTTG